MSTQNEKNLALAIASCSDVCSAISDQNHPCHKVVDWQAKQHNPMITEVKGSKLHRPEPWTGDLATAKIMFLSSNPSFNPEENFPSWNEEQWSDEDISLFGAERFTTSASRKYGAMDAPSKAVRDRTIGIDGELSGSVTNWNWVRQFAAFAIGKQVTDTSAISDYVMTELVHCKSKSEAGVPQALSHCTEKWFDKIMEVSPAQIIFVAGTKTAKTFVEIFGEDMPTEWGSWAGSEYRNGKGAWPKTVRELDSMVEAGKWNLEAQSKNTCTLQIAGKSRLVVFIARPGGGGGVNTPWNHAELVHPELLKFWRSHL